MAIDYDKTVEHYSAMKLPQMAAELKSLNQEVEAQDRILKDLKAKRDILRINVIPERMEEEGTSNATYKGVGRLQLTGDAHVSTVKGAKDDLMQWLIDNDFEDLITEVVNASTLKAFYKEQFEKGNPVPPDTIVRFDPFTRASITKV